ncbi:hypothetical protein M5D96_004555 [Drosophila gunungcola]|uniref:Cilia- and flagella-associated protein 91 n=1 Tax=Drosophila gunungcola TaxID=103775 RepID=A0A9P9YUQ0_9MUSC|nr:hypothetical protein M5D96_004555 [Drosophila gunungcola]
MGREEQIQECQMMRLEIVIKMFDKREKEMHAASKTRLERGYELIEKRRKEALQKNEIEYQRGMRQISKELAKTSLKYGVDPARRNFASTTGTRAFNMRIDELERQINLRIVECPFAKLKQWSRPKERIQEVENRFCSETHLDALYQSLRKLSSAIGYVLQFLTDEMKRLREERRMHFLSVLAQKERWRRESIEAGLRQKENTMRMLYEEMFQQSNLIRSDISNRYILNILTNDNEATETVTGLARQIDVDIERWLESFKLIQNPLTFIPLRLMLKDMVCPDLNAVLQRYETSMIAQYIVDEVIFGRVWKELEPESESPQDTSWYEAHAIIRKLIRQSVPGRRWKEEIERIVYENYNDLLDDIFTEIIYKNDNPAPIEPVVVYHSLSHENLLVDVYPRKPRARPINSNSVLPSASPRKEETLRQKKRVTFTHGKQQRSFGESSKARDNDKVIGQGLTSCLITKPSDTRLTSGANNPAVRNAGRLPRTDSECQFKEPGIFFLQNVHSDLATQEVKLNSKPLRKELKNKCDFFPKYVDNRPFNDVATQTLYRESSAQTLAFLPEVQNRERNETVELFSLAKLLPGDKPPGLHEVELLERSRRRWDFKKALKANLQRLLNEARQAFEWEHWIQREEDIQECQMMRLEIVIKMFDKREKEMRAASKSRIEKSFEGIQKRRLADLHKNEVEYQRGMRRIGIQLAKTSRNPMQALGSPCSEFYGPLTRHGVDPARRSFESSTGRKAFDMRIDDLEKRVNMRNVHKLKEWSKPKEYDREYERNFCNDDNLQRLYESLKTLRTQADMAKDSPNCLKTRLRIEHRTPSTDSSDSYPSYNIGRQELENLICSYEGSYIGSIMQFLSNEMQRLKEQRKLHFFSILAQKERWRREAAEAGLRQKENAMRLMYEEMFQFCNDEAAETVAEMAKQIDADIERWLESFKLIQNPLTFTPLRLMLQDMVCPDLNAVLQRYETSMIAQYIVEDVIFDKVWQELEPDLIDRLIDNDLYLFSSSESESEGPQKVSWYEAHAVVRKLIRQAVPGRRWKEENERIATEVYNSLFDDVFDEILFKFENPSQRKESSAQTMNYLPEILDADKEQTLELFSLPSVLPGANPPGLHEVEILERARKRWAFNDALKIHFKRLLEEARNVAIKTQHKEILEAFEWEHWIQREEDIQECQMMRLEIVIKMFDKREKEMHAASNSRIEKACERIEKCRQAGLRKNEIEFQRGMRRLEFQVTNTPRRWLKQSPMHSLGSPCSEFYAPLLRYGTNPARRNFVSKTEQKAFDMRIDELEKRVNTSNLKCPFRKLKDWSKPKKHEKEYERNFCNDDNLQKLFENLKALRTQAAKEKAEPKCLRKRWKQTMTRTASQMSLGFVTHFYEDESDDSFKEEKRKTPDIDKWANFIEKEKARNSDTVIAKLKNERNQEGLENILNIYEGTYIGWVMQFLSEEMSRLSELRRLHFFSIMCQKERWRREAAEAGLRQKENDMRLMYEELFQHCNVVNNDVSNEYITTILNSDMYNVAEGEATETVGELAKQIDADIERWLESFKLIQNPLTFVPLRLMLKEQVSPNMNEALQRHEKSLIVNYVVEDVIFRKVWLELDPFDIASTLTSDLIDRLIDNDLYLMSTDSESEIPQKSSWREAHAIVRKLIRQAVPGRRWLEDGERIVTENYNDLIDDIFASILHSMDHPPAVRSADLIDLRMTMSHSDIRSSDDIREKDNFDNFDYGNLNSLPGSNFLRKQMFTLMRKFKIDNITRLLENLDKVPVEERPSGDDEFIGAHMINPISNIGNQESDLFSIRSTLNISETLDLSPLKGRGYRVVLPQGAEKNGCLGVLKLLEKEDDEEEKLELSIEPEHDKEIKDIYFDSPKVSFDQMLLSSDKPMELYSELPQPSKSPNQELEIEKEDVKPLDSTDLKLEQMDATPKELEQQELTHNELELMDSTPKELEHIVDIVDSTPKELIPTSLDSKDLSIDSIPKDLEPPKEAIKEQELKTELAPKPMVSHSSSFIPPVRSSGPKVLHLPESSLKPDKLESKEHIVDLVDSTPKELIPTSLDSKDLSIDSIPKDLEPPKEATKEQELKTELAPKPMVSHSSSFIPPVRSSGPKVLKLPESSLKPDMVESKEKAINIKMNKPIAQKETEIEEKMYIGSLGSHFEIPLDAVIPIQTSDDHLPVNDITVEIASRAVSEVDLQ